MRLILPIGGVGPRGKLVDARRQDGPLQPADVVAVCHEVLGQGVEQALVGRRIGDREVIHRIDEATTQVMGPDAIDEAAGEVRIVRPDHPLEQLRADRCCRPAPGPPGAWAARSCCLGVRQRPLHRARTINLLHARQGRCLGGAFLAALGQEIGDGGTRLRRDAEANAGEDVGIGAVVGSASSGRTDACGTGRIRGGRPGTRRRSSRPTAPARSVLACCSAPEQVEAVAARRRRRVKPLPRRPGARLRLA